MFNDRITCKLEIYRSRCGITWGIILASAWRNRGRSHINTAQSWSLGQGLNASWTWNVSATHVTVMFTQNSLLSKNKPLFASHMANCDWHTCAVNSCTDLFFGFANLEIQTSKLSGVACYEQFYTIISFTSQELISFYMYFCRSVDDIDLYTGALAEQPLNGSFLGPTITCLLTDQFVRLKRGDRFWYETPEHPQAFTPGEVLYIKGKAIPLQAWRGPYGSRRLRFPEFLDIRHMKVAMLSALHTGHL
jgi:hypothetical protein